MKESAKESAGCGREKANETKEASAEGWTLVEGGNKETNKKASGKPSGKPSAGVPTEKVNATDSEDQPP